MIAHKKYTLRTVFPNTPQAWDDAGCTKYFDAFKLFQCTIMNILHRHLIEFSIQLMGSIISV